MLPSLFVAQGVPLLALEDNAYIRYIRELATTLPKPDTVVMVTSQRDCRFVVISAADQYGLIRDTRGFPKELLNVSYPARGNRLLASDIGILCEKEGIPYRFEYKSELDYGAWAVLRWLYPQADIPVVALSVNGKLVPEEQYRLGQMLAPLRRSRNMLIVGSGGTIHNLHKLSWKKMNPDDWAVGFDNWLAQQIAHWDTEALFDYVVRAPHVRDAVPEQGKAFLAPLFIAMGAADPEKQGDRLHQSYRFGCLSLNCWSFGG